MSDQGAQLRSNECWFLWREENRRKTLEAVKGENQQQTLLTYATHAPLVVVVILLVK
jgi:hypothetical protein